MDGKKEYSLVINGIRESIDAVESLNKQLDTLEKRIDAVSKKNVNVSSSSSGGGSKNDDLAAEEKLQRQIINQEDKIIGARKDEYQILLQQKAEFKEINELQKANVANARLQDNAYANTMQGMKQQLADIKAVMQTTDVDSDKFRQLGEQANALNEKLKQIEQSYGQYGRNVGNYANSIADGLSKVVVKVGDVERTFKSARDASRTLNNELKSLSINGKRGTKEWKELNSAIIKMNASMNGSSLALQRMITMLQGFSAAAQVGKGITSLFGFDNQEITQSIQKLVALQSVLSGLQTIQKQLAANKGLGLMFNGAFGKIDQYNFALKRMIVSLSGTGTAARVAAAGVNFLSGAIKGLMSLGVIALITAAISAISKIGTKIKDWAKGNADLVSSEKLLERQLEQTNKELERKLELNNKLYGSGQITQDEKKINDEKAYADAIGKANDALQKQLELASKRGSNTSFANAALGNQSWLGDKGVTTFGGFSEGLKTMDDLVKRYELLTKAVEKNKGVTENANSEWGRVSLSASDARDELNHLEQLVAGDMVNSFRKFNLATEDGRKQFINFVQNIQQNGNELQQSVLFRMGDILNQNSPQLASALNGYLSIVQQFVNNFNGETEKLNIMGEVNNAIRSADPTIALKEQNEKWKKYLDEHGSELQISEVAAINKAMDANKKKIREYGQKKIKSLQSANAKVEKSQEEALQRLNDLEIKLMNDGLMKQLRQLDEENRRVCAQIRKNGVNVGELIKRQEQYYAQERKKIIEDYIAETDEILSNAKIDKYEAKIEQIENKIRDLNGRRPINPTPADNEILSRMFEGLGEDEAELFVSTFNATLDKKSKDSIEALTKFMDSLKDNPKWQKYSNQFDYYINTGEIENATNMALEIFKKYYGERVKLIQRYGADFVVIDEQEGAVAMQVTSELSESLESRLVNNRQYFEAYLKEYEDFIKQQKKLAKKSENTSYNSERDKLEKERDKLKDSTDENEIARREAINKQIEALTIAHKNKLKQIEIDADDKIKAAGAKFYDMQLASYNDFLSAMSNLADKQPVLFKSGFVNIKATKANFEEVKNTAMQTIKSIDADIEQLQEDFDNGLIDGETYQAMLRQFTSIGVSANQAFVSAEQGMENAKEKFRRQIMEIAEQVSQTAQQMISAFGDLYNYNIQKELDAIDELNRKLEEKLDEQRDIEERHKNEVESIEDELANSRGDRRSQLIDMLNAETQARREAAAEQKRIEAEMKANERKQEELEKKKAKAQYKRDLAQILISGAMAAANGFATKPFLPTGLAMGALATTLATAQYLIAKKQKPYAKGGELDGGVIKGKRHYAGGVSVLGGRASVEGGEFITNRVTTAKNADLLGYINTKKHKIDLSELIDFYQKPIKANGTSRRMYANGGQLPTLPDIDLSSSMANLAVIRDDRPVTVSVVDINNKQDDVRRVKVLSGLNPR